MLATSLVLWGSLSISWRVFSKGENPWARDPYPELELELETELDQDPE